MHPSLLSIKDFSYHLPEEKIALFPLGDRDASRLLIWKEGEIREDIYRHIAHYLPPNALLVFNNTKVVEARLLFPKPTGAVIEIFVLEPLGEHQEISTAMHAKGSVTWKCLIGGAGKWKHGQVLEKKVEGGPSQITLQARIMEKLTGSFVIEFSWEPSITFAALLHRVGVMPIPPYLKRDSSLIDNEKYQTVYATQDGSVAAPTAGLHFTAETFASLAQKGIEPAFITLHVGAGTFMPVKSETLEGHQMHTEFMEIEKSFVDKLLASSKQIIAVGTTSLRTLESIYWMGVKCFYQPAIVEEDLVIKQWEVYNELADRGIPVAQAIGALKNWMTLKNREILVIKTQILIAPPYKPKLVKGLITNFHQPDSTLLLLVAALIGDSWHKVYDYALEHDFRFLSYGDGSLLFID